MKLLFLSMVLMLCLLDASAWATPCGNTAASSGNNGGNSNLDIGAAACVPVSNSTVNSCSITVNQNQGSHIACAVYANSASKPSGAALCSSASVVSTLGANVISLSGCGTLTSGSTYWVVANTDGSTVYAVTATTVSANGAFKAATYPTFVTGDSSWTADNGAGSAKFLLFSIDITAAGAGQGLFMPPNLTTGAGGPFFPNPVTRGTGLPAVVAWALLVTLARRRILTRTLYAITHSVSLRSYLASSVTGRIGTVPVQRLRSFEMGSPEDSKAPTA